MGRQSTDESNTLMEFLKRPCDVEALDRSVKQQFAQVERLGQLVNRLREL